jgi:hypothetical protein
MLRIKEINFGLIPTGPAVGTSALQIYFEEDEIDYKPDEYDLYFSKWKDGFDPKTGKIDEHPRELFDSLYKIMMDNYEVQFRHSINGTQTCFLTYMGGLVDHPKYFQEFNRLQIDLSNRSRNFQISTGVHLSQLKAPFSVFIGTPTFMTGKNQFYELFNITYPVICIDDKGISKYNSLAFQESLNGPATIATIFIKKGAYLNDIAEIMSTYKLPGHKVLLMDIEGNEDVQKFAMQYFFRYYPYLKGKNFLEILN